jgi:hypothetical protein
MPTPFSSHDKCIQAEFIATKIPEAADKKIAAQSLCL